MISRYHPCLSCVSIPTIMHHGDGLWLLLTAHKLSTQVATALILSGKIVIPWRRSREPLAPQIGPSGSTTQAGIRPRATTVLLPPRTPEVLAGTLATEVPHAMRESARGCNSRPALSVAACEPNNLRTHSNASTALSRRGFQPTRWRSPLGRPSRFGRPWTWSVRGLRSVCLRAGAVSQVEFKPRIPWPRSSHRGSQKSSSAPRPA